MEEPPKKRPILEQKTTQLMLFKGALGWTAFILTATLWVSSSKRHANSIESHHKEIQEKDEVVTQRDTTIGKKDKLIQSRESEITNRNTKITKLDEKIAQLQHLLKEEKSQTQVKLDSELKKRIQLYSSIRDSITIDKVGQSTLDFWANTLSKTQSGDKKLNEQFHSLLAEQYFKLGIIDKTKNHLALSNHFDPALEQQINESLDLDTAILSVEQAIQKRLPADQLAAKLKNAHALVDELSKNPAKKVESESLRTKLLKLETVAALNAPPKEALSSLQRLIQSQKTAAEKATSPLSQRLHFLDTATMAYGLSRSLNRTEDADNYKKQVDLAADLVSKLEKSHPQISHAKASVKLRELDALFIDGEATSILKAVSQLQAFAKLSDDTHSIIFAAAADGHKAAVLFDRGELTNGRKLLTSAIDKLNAVCLKSPTHGLAHFRLGILHWLQAQLTTSEDITYLHLNHSSEALVKASTNADKLQERAIRQFAAMVDGDLGHLNAEKGKKDDAKKHFTLALKNWDTIIKTWGENEETKEGVRYCKWRLSKL